LAERRHRPVTPTDNAWWREVGGSPNDIESHALARGSFMRVIKPDARVIAFLENGGVMDSARALAIEGDRLAGAMHLQRRRDLFAGDFPEPPPGSFIRKTSAWMSACRETVQKLRTLEIRKDAERLVRRTWDLRWAWLTMELVSLKVFGVVATLIDDDLSFDFRVTTPTDYPPAFQFAPTTNETPEESWDRVLTLIAAIVAPPSDKEAERVGVRPEPSRIARNVEWFYRRNLKEPKDPIGLLAREYYEGHRDRAMLAGKDHRSTVRAGIKNAAKLLSDIPTSSYTPEKTPKG
jgi:hypothetical protein